MAMDECLRWRLQPAPRNSGFRMDGCFVRCASAIKLEPARPNRATLANHMATHRPIREVFPRRSRAARRLHACALGLIAASGLLRSPAVSAEPKYYLPETPRQARVISASMITPMRTMTVTIVPVSRSPATTPIIARGIVSRTIKG